MKSTLARRRRHAHVNFFRLQYLHPKIAGVARRFWLAALSNKGRRGQRNREELGAGATSRLRRSCARLDKTAMLRRLTQKVIVSDWGRGSCIAPCGKAGERRSNTQIPSLTVFRAKERLLTVYVRSGSDADLFMSRT